MHILYVPNRGSKKISTVSTTTVISEISNYTSSSNANWDRIILPKCLLSCYGC